MPTDGRSLRPPPAGRVDEPASCRGTARQRDLHRGRCGG